MTLNRRDFLKLAAAEGATGAAAVTAVTVCASGEVAARRRDMKGQRGANWAKEVSDMRDGPERGDLSQEPNSEPIASLARVADDGLGGPSSKKRFKFDETSGCRKRRDSTDPNSIRTNPAKSSKRLTLDFL